MTKKLDVLFELAIGDKVSSIVLDSDSVNESVTLKTSKGRDIKLESYHQNDCCEHVFADFSGLKDVKKEIVGKTFDVMKITGVEGIGFLLHLDKKSFLIPCHNNQNGYYSRNLELKIYDGPRTTTVDITELTKGSEY